MGHKRNYTEEDVKRLQGSVQIEHTLAKQGAENLRRLLEENDYINTIVKNVFYLFINSYVLMVGGIIGVCLLLKNTLVIIEKNYIRENDIGLNILMLLSIALYLVGVGQTGHLVLRFELGQVEVGVRLGSDF